MPSIKFFPSLLLVAGFALHATAAANPDVVSAAQSHELAARVKAETRRAWQGYMKYAAGHDEIRPLSKQAHDWYAQPLLMTPVDALDTLIVMGLDDEAEQARELIETRLSFDRDIYVKTFEITIRHLGGLLSAYQLTGEKKLLTLADDLGTRLLPAFDSPSGLPYVDVNLRTGKTRGTDSGPAESGTLLLEFGTLARLTGKQIYYDKAKHALVETYKRRSRLGLVGATFDVASGKWISPDSSVAGGIDSYYEYLYKCWRLFGDTDCKAMWETSIKALNAHVADTVRKNELWYGHVDMNTGAPRASQWGSLDAFFAALLAVSGDIDRARRLQDSNMKMWRLHGIEPESLDYRAMKTLDASYSLRPEIVESAYYLRRLTGDTRYLDEGREMFEDFEHWCRTDTGFAALESVVTKRQKDSQESFLYAETLKYFYLLFAPDSALDFDSVTFNTEAHPLRRTWKN
ncbi:MAG: glycoside hydrolase family 47 protein [Proteobacteria bacterium]|nr:glycoside hydrolase family 47 protein [Pseudomonadota bacterium]